MNSPKITAAMSAPVKTRLWDLGVGGADGQLVGEWVWWVGVVKGERVGVGPGSVRVGQLIGRLGVVSLPAVQVGLGLEERVVRRHVSRLEAVGWLGRAAGVRGEGSVVWLTAQGLKGVELGGLRAVPATPAPSATLTTHSLLVAWSAVRAQRRGRRWLSGRELAVEPEGWAVAMVEPQRGLVWRLPDLVVWLPTNPQAFAVIGEQGQRRFDRQRAILEGWRDALLAERYAGVRYDCASPSVAQRIARMAAKLGLTEPRFIARVQNTPEQIAAIPLATQTDPPAPVAPETASAPVSAPPPSQPAPRRSSRHPRRPRNPRRRPSRPLSASA